MAVFAVVATHSASLEELKTPCHADRGRYYHLRTSATLGELEEEEEEAFGPDNEELGDAMDSEEDSEDDEGDVV